MSVVGTKLPIRDVCCPVATGGKPDITPRPVSVAIGAPCQLRLLAGQEHGRTIPLAVISHNASIARLYLGLLFSSAAEQVVLAAA
jgi:hypothetical protein